MYKICSNEKKWPVITCYVILKSRRIILITRKIQMNFNVYVNKNTGDRVAKMAKTLHRSRNSIVNEALEEWLNKHTPSRWPKGFFDFDSVEDVPDFKALRRDLNPIKEDPLE